MFRTLKDLDVKGKRVLVRVDFNVPLKAGKVADGGRIAAALPTIKYLLGKNATVILLTHLGRPKGVDKKFSVAPVGRYLSKLLKRPVRQLNDCVGPSVELAVHASAPGSVILLENVRFHDEEENNDARFSAQLSRFADCYVNDAFGTCHRAHASVEGVTHHLPSAAGFLLENEIKVLTSLLENPRRPFVAIMGGAKVSDKIGVISNLAKKADAVLIGGAMMFTFERALGRSTGRSLVEEDKLDVARMLLKDGHGKIVLPVDTLIAKDIKNSKGACVVAVDAVPADMMGVDIGTETIAIYESIIKNAKTVVWNGPLEVFETAAFAKGTYAVARAMAANKGVTVVGGGETAEAVRKAKVERRITHVSTGGGASLEFLEGKTLPGIAALEKNLIKYG